MKEKLWGGRFRKEVNEKFFDFQKSIHFDVRLAKYDLYHSLFHILVLESAGILTKEERLKLEKALRGILEEIEKNRFTCDFKEEDIHSEIQKKVREKVGELVLKLHTFRSRNEQIVFDEKWFCFDVTEKLINQLKEIQKAIKFLQLKYKKTVFLGYTHTQRAQIIYFKDYLSTYLNFLEEIKDKLKIYKKEIILYVGSGALYGTCLQAKYFLNAIEKFKKQIKITPKIKFSKYPLYNVTSRSFLLDFLHLLTLLQIYLSYFAQDLILYSTKEFSFVKLPDEYCTGSSFLPHKKNADFLELIRGATAIILGNYASFSSLLKALPLTYNRDLQWDKKILFSSLDILEKELDILPDFIKKLKLDEEKIKKAIEEDDSLFAVEITRYLVLKGVPFKKAHDKVGELFRYAEENKKTLNEFSEEELNKISPYLTGNVLKEIKNKWQF